MCCVLQAGLHGLTGHIEFNEGKRSNFKLDLLKLKREELRTVGYWSPGMGINVTDPTAFYESSVTNITLVVMTREVRILSIDFHTLPGKKSGPGSSVGTATQLRDGRSWIESRWRRDFPPVQTGPGVHTQAPVKWVPGLSRRPGRGADHSPPSSAAVMEE